MSTTFSSPGTGPVGNSAGKRSIHGDLEAALKAAQTLHKEVTEVNKITGQASSRLSYSLPPMPPPSYGGGSPNIPGPVASAAADNGGRGTWARAKEIGSNIMAFMPSASAGIERQQRTFYGGVAVGDYNLGEVARKDAMGAMRGNLTSVNADVRMNQMMMNAGWNQQSQMRGVYGVASFAARMTGMQNEVAAGAHMATVGNVDFQNAGLISGVRTKDAKGNALTGVQLWQNIYNRFIAPYYANRKGGKDAFLRAMQPGGGMATNAMIASMDPNDRQNFMTWVVNKLSGQKNGTPGEANDAMKNPNVSAMGLTGAENQRVETSMDDSVRGYVYANQGLEKLSEGLDAAYKALGPFTAALQMLSGAMVASSATMLGRNTMSAAGAGANRLFGGGGGGGGGGGSRLYAPGRMSRAFGPGGKFGKLGNLGSKLARPLSRFGGKVASKIGGKLLPGIGLAVGAFQGYKSGKSGEGFWGGMGTAVTGGAVAGGILGSFGGGVGAVPGAILGAIGGALTHTIGYGIGAFQKSRDEKKAAEEAGIYQGDEEEVVSGLTDTWGRTEQPASRAKGAWKITRGEIARLHENEMVLPADVAQSFRSAVQNHLTMGDGGNKSGPRPAVKVEVTLNNASWGEAQKLIKVVQKALDTDDELELLGTT